MRAWFDESIDVEFVQRRFAHLPVEVRFNSDFVFVRESDDRDPVYAGARFVIVPASSSATLQLPPDRIVLPIDAAMAFGSGRHETTQLCLEALEHSLKPGNTVFDVGCGSGILALASQRLGAGLVVGVDIDEPALAVARRHFSGPLFVGSADGFLAKSADLVICNITGKVIDRLAHELHRITKPGGWLILSGFTAYAVPSRFEPTQILNQGEWYCWICSVDDTRTNPGEWPPEHHETEWWL